MSNYRPINCHYYDELEIVAMRRQAVPIVYLNDDNRQIEVTTKIKDLYARNQEEFIVLEDGTEFRLDRLISMDGKLNGEGSCAIHTPPPQDLAASGGNPDLKE